MNGKFHHWLGCVATLAVVAATPPSDVHACHNGVEIRMTPEVFAVNNAEALVGEGKAEEAKKVVLAALPGVQKKAVGASGLNDRALIVLARAAVRSDGKAFHGHALAEPSVEDRQKAFRWSIQIFKDLRARKPDSTAVVTDLAEAMSYVPAERRESREMLERLERQDLMATAQGYAALAAVRADVAEGQPVHTRAPLLSMVRYQRELELLRCREMAQNDAVCERKSEPITPRGA